MSSRVGRDEAVATIRAFSRFYTRHLGVIRETLLGTEYSLAEARVLFELAQRDDATAGALGDELDIDRGYMSRILAELRERDLVAQARSKEDGRRRILRLTAAGRRAFATLDRRSEEQIAAMIDDLSPKDRARLVEALRTARELLG